MREHFLNQELILSDRGIGGLNSLGNFKVSVARRMALCRTGKIFLE
jgi:hypothetical protein